MTDKDYILAVRAVGDRDAVHQAYLELGECDAGRLVGRARLRRMDEHRRLCRIKQADLDCAGGIDPVDVAMKQEVCHQVRQAITKLSPRYRRIVLLRWIDGLSPKEIARRYGIPVQTIYTQLRRAEEVLRVLIPSTCVGAIR